MNKTVSGTAEKSNRLNWTLQTFALLVTGWLILDGWQTLWLGLPASMAAAMLASSLAPDHRHFWLSWRLAGFLGFFLWESLRGGVDVGWRAMHPRLPISPAFCRHRMTLPDGQPRTLLISTISLLPGTLSADLEDDGRHLIVHSLVAGAEASVSRLDHWIAWL